MLTRLLKRMRRHDRRSSSARPDRALVEARLREEARRYDRDLVELARK